jgi:hypothetical protein
MKEQIVSPTPQPSYIAFAGDRRIAAGSLREVAHAAKQALDRDRETRILVFDDDSGQVELDFRGTVDDVLGRLPAVAGVAAPEEPAPPRGPGRPRLGVVAREVTLLPRHWDWLSRQPGGASVALRRLVEDARRVAKDKDRLRRAQETTYRFITVMGGNKPHYEEAARALFARDAGRFARWTEGWPADVRNHARSLAAAAFEDAGPPAAGEVDRAAANR